MRPAFPNPTDRAGGDGQSRVDLARLVEASCSANFRQAVVSVEDGASVGPAKSVIRLAVGTAGELASVVPGLPTGASIGADGRFPRHARLRPRRWSCRDRPGRREGRDRLRCRRRRPAARRRANHDRHAAALLPDVPMIDGEQRLSSPTSASPTEEFSGRRFEAISSRPAGGLLFRRLWRGDALSRCGLLPTMCCPAATSTSMSTTTSPPKCRSRRPTETSSAPSDQGDDEPFPAGRECHLRSKPCFKTEADAVCAPGASAGGPDRFVLFDTSEFFMPGFGRIERWPDLSALVGDRAFPTPERGAGADRARPCRRRDLRRGADLPVAHRGQRRAADPGCHGPARRARQRARDLRRRARSVLRAHRRGDRRCRSGAHRLGRAGAQSRRGRCPQRRSRQHRPNSFGRSSSTEASTTAGRRSWSVPAASGAAGSNSSAGSSGTSISPSPRSPSDPDRTRLSIPPTARPW